MQPLPETNSSDTCKPARGACGPHLPTYARAGSVRFWVRRVPYSPKLPVKPSIFQQKGGSPGRRPAGGGAHTAGLRPGFSAAEEESRKGFRLRRAARRGRPSQRPRIRRWAAGWRGEPHRRAGRRGEKQDEPRSRDAAARFRLAAVAGEEPKGAEDSRE